MFRPDIYLFSHSSQLCGFTVGDHPSLSSDRYWVHLLFLFIPFNSNQDTKVKCPKRKERVQVSRSLQMLFAYGIVHAVVYKTEFLRPGYLPRYVVCCLLKNVKNIWCCRLWFASGESAVYDVGISNFPKYKVRPTALRKHHDIPT